jgi:catechol 2,3-dioxygenase-like lactoylglutathione lyase family enzyme
LLALSTIAHHNGDVMRFLPPQQIRHSGIVTPRFRSPQVIIFSDDLPVAAAFYERLGFRETFRTPVDGDPIHVDLELDGYRIGIASGRSTREDHGLEPVTTGQRAAVVLWTDDTAASYGELVGTGTTGLRPPTRWLDRLLIAWVADPDGNPVQLVQDLQQQVDGVGHSVVRSTSAQGRELT